MKFLSYDGLLYFCQKIKALLAGKVDKVDGKGLSTNDYTTAEKTKLAGLMNYIHPTTSGNKHIPAGGSANQILGWSADGTAKWVNEKDTTYSVMSGATVDADGKSGLVPSPTKGAQRWLDSTGAWTTPPNTTYGAASTTSAGLMSTADKKKLDAFGAASTYALKSDITAMYRYKGSVASYDKLPTSGQIIGDVYDVGNGMNYAWNGEKWDGLGQVFTIDAIQNTEIDTILAS